MADNASILFLDETHPPPPAVTPPLKILSVDDDKNFQRSTAFALSKIKVLGRPIDLLQAFNSIEAARLLSVYSDIAIVLLDVVMETENAGLHLVRTVREVLDNQAIRIVLVTGQPGMAPMDYVMRKYDINDYWTKTELTSDRLQTILTTNVRSYEQICAIAHAKRGLQLIAESSSALYSSRSLKELSAKILGEMAKLLKVPTEGIVCVRSNPTARPQIPSPQIISASGRFLPGFGKTLSQLNNKEIRERLQHCLNKRESCYAQDYICLFFPCELAGADYAAYITTGRQVDTTETELIRVFSMNICRSLHNVSLVSQLDRLAYEDDLLKIPNRNVLLRTLNGIIREKQRDNFALVLIDIDKFSSINTVLGARQGDAILAEVASRLRSAFDSEVLVARVKDDQFAVLGPEETVNAKAIAALFQPVYGRDDMGIAVNVSTATFPLKLAGTSARDVLTRAGISLKQAKHRGINQHLEYDSGTDTKNARQFELLQALQKGIEQQELHIALQPQVCIHTGELHGLEVLARWTRADGTSISPQEFIPLAETTGLIVQLGEQVLTQACAAAQILAQAGFGHLRIGINLSVTEFEQSDMFERLQRHIHETGILPEQIEVEVTESAAMQNFSSVRRCFEAMRNLNIKIAIDDFGIGFSSLAYLSQLPADHLKIDKSFIDKVPRNNGASAIAQAIIQLGDRFRLSVIAEGVETLEQLQWLRDKGCNEVQGYVIARPMPLSDLMLWLKQYCPRPAL